LWRLDPYWTGYACRWKAQLHPIDRSLSRDRLQQRELEGVLQAPSLGLE
jgi:hypothetical protein